MSWPPLPLAKLIKDKQPDLFKYLLDGRSKRAVAKLVGAGQPLSIPAGGTHRPPDIPRPWLSWQIMHKGSGLGVRFAA